MGISLVVHGNEFTALGIDAALDLYQSAMLENVDVEPRGRLGEEPRDHREIKVLNRIARISAHGLAYEAGPRHAELLGKALGLEQCKCYGTPGSNDVNDDTICGNAREHEDVAVHEGSLSGIMSLQKRSAWCSRIKQLNCQPQAVQQCVRNAPKPEIIWVPSYAGTLRCEPRLCLSTGGIATFTLIPLKPCCAHFTGPTFCGPRHSEERGPSRIIPNFQASSTWAPSGPQPCPSRRCILGNSFSTACGNDLEDGCQEEGRGANGTEDRIRREGGPAAGS